MSARDHRTQKHTGNSLVTPNTIQSVSVAYSPVDNPANQEDWRVVSWPNVLKAILAGSWFGVKGRASRDSCILQWNTFAIISGLFIGPSSTGLFVSVHGGLHTAFQVLWCVATLGMASATLGYVIMIVGVIETTTDHEFRVFTTNLGSLARIPLMLLVLSGLAFYLGICVFFVMKLGLLTSFMCIGFCFSILCVPLVISLLCVTKAALQVTQDLQNHADLNSCDSEAIYNVLKAYYTDECDDNFGRMVRGEFLHRFTGHGETCMKVAARIYDDWVERKCDSMLIKDFMIDPAEPLESREPTVSSVLQQFLLSQKSQQQQMLESQHRLMEFQSHQQQSMQDFQAQQSESMHSLMTQLVRETAALRNAPVVPLGPHPAAAPAAEEPHALALLQE